MRYTYCDLLAQRAEDVGCDHFGVADLRSHDDRVAVITACARGTLPDDGADAGALGEVVAASRGTTQPPASGPGC